MVKDHISRDAAIAELQRVYDLLSGYHPSFYAGFQFAVKTLESIQVADVVPVEHGRWCVGFVCPWNDVVGNWKCSVCGGVSLKNSAYCPNCGAKMDLEENYGKA